jgi:glycosyltransferase involved in cell wall biosynthesis
MHVVRPSAGGIRSHLAALIKESDREKFEHMVACPPGDMADFFVREGVKTFCIPIRAGLSLPGDIAAVGKLVILLKKNTTDIVHAHSSRAGLVGRLAANLAGVPAVILTVHSSIFYQGRPLWEKSLFALCERLLAVFTGRIITVSNALRREVIDREKISPEKVVTVYNGIVPEDFSLKPDREYLQKTAGIPADRRLVGTVARLALQKGVDSFIRAAARLSSHPDGPLFLIVGDGPLRAKLEREVRNCNLGGRVFFTGQRYDVNRIMPCLDVFVLASVTEGLPLTVLEAMAAGRPVVATRVGGIPEAVSDGIDGILVNPGDICGLAAAIGKLLSDPDRSAEMGNKGRLRVISDFTVKKMVSGTERIYTELVACNVSGAFNC